MLTSLFIPLAYAQEVSQVAMESNLLADLMKAGLAVQSLLICLIVMSILSWGIIFSKHKQIKEATESDHKFEDRFWKSKSLQDVYDLLDDYPLSPLTNVFRSGYNELMKILELRAADESGASPAASLDNLERALRKASDIELARYEYRLGILATTGSTAPFIGLLGTVVGIMNSFRDIYKAGSASLATVAPGISEALFATAVGLFAAIPAVIFYNFFIGKVRRAEIRMGNFSSDFLNIARRNFLKD
jgi:biopolymer transport protein TolQ